jgi:NADH-quinone oxidoreductase subunit J
MAESATELSVFWLLATASVAAALTVVLARRVLRSAVALAAVLVCTAGFQLLLGYEFLAGVQMLVYVGGIVVLLVYAIMLTGSAELLDDLPSPRRKLVGAVTASAFFATATLAVNSADFDIAIPTEAPPRDLAHQFGRLLLDPGKDGFVLPFEIISLLLLAAVIGAIVVARKLPKGGQSET